MNSPVYFRLVCAFCLIVSSNLALAATKIPAELYRQLESTKSLELIVEYDDTEIENTINDMRSKLPTRRDNDEIRAHKAEKYKALKDQVDLAAHRQDIEEIRTYTHLPISFKRFKSVAALNTFIAQPGIKAVHINEKVYLASSASLTLINQPPASSLGDQGSGATVAIIDNGIDYTNPAFGSCTSLGNPSANCHVIMAQNIAANPSTDHTHGTNVAAIALGVAPASKIAMFNVFNASGGASSADIITAIDNIISYQGTYNIAAINMSLSTNAKYTSKCTNDWSAKPIADAKKAGISVVAAAGNSAFKDGLGSPACAPDAISVGAVYDSNMGGLNWTSCVDNSTSSNKVVCFSNSASYLTILAPGVNISAAGIIQSGTSQASPHVAGAIAVLRSAFPSETITQTQDRLINNRVIRVTDSANNISTPRLDLLQAVAATPANDNFSSSSAINNPTNATSGPNFTVNGLSILSTKESGEPNHAGNSGGHSVWWKWTAPASGQFSLDTHGSNYDTLLAVYRGSSVNALTNIAANDDDGFSNGNSSLVLQAQSGLEYNIAVDGANGADGFVQLNWSLNTSAIANLTVGITGPTKITNGSSANYVINVSNAGPQKATNVIVSTIIPTGAVFISSSATCSTSLNIVTCLVGDLGSNASTSLTMQLLWNNLSNNSNLSTSASSDVPTNTINNIASVQLTTNSMPDNGDIPTLPQWAMAMMMALLFGVKIRARLFEKINNG